MQNRLHPKIRMKSQSAGVGQHLSTTLSAAGSCGCEITMRSVIETCLIKCDILNLKLGTGLRKYVQRVSIVF